MEFLSTPAHTTGEVYVDAGDCQAALADHCAAFPQYASAAFWQMVEDPALPLETLVKMVRMAVCFKDVQGRERLLETLLARMRAFDERWASRLLGQVSLGRDERQAMIHDLCADLHEGVLRAVIDPERLFWEENFLHCLYFERKHVYRSFMTREGWWQQQGSRVPRILLNSLDQMLRPGDMQSHTFDIEDQNAQSMLLTVERGGMLPIVILLPEKLKAVVLLIFWEGRSEKETARILGISDRAVRYRLRGALKRLRGMLLMEGDVSSHA